MRNFVLLAFCLVAPVAAAPDPAALAVMGRVARYQLAHPSPERFDSWQQGTFLAGLSALDRAAADLQVHEALLRIGEGNAWTPGPSVYLADDLCVAQAYLELNGANGDPSRIAAVRTRCDFILAHPKTGPIDFTAPGGTDRWSWCDALFMAAPVWVRLSDATGQARYRDFAVKEWWAASDRLYDPAERLFFRDKTFLARREGNGAKVFWGRGEGWAFAALARVLDCLPADHPSRPLFIRQFREMAERLGGLQQSDGSWCPSLLAPEAYSPKRESSATGLICYGLAWGVNQRILDQGTYGPAVRKAWRALVECVTPEGRLTFVQPQGKGPKSFDPANTEAYGVGAFLLAGSEVCRLAGPR